MGYQIRQRPNDYFNRMCSHQHRYGGNHNSHQKYSRMRFILRANSRATHTSIVITNAWIAMLTTLTPPPTKSCRNMSSPNIYWHSHGTCGGSIYRDIPTHQST